jgi:hypothetical protein
MHLIQNPLITCRVTRIRDNMVMSPVGLGTKNHCADEDQQQFSSQAVKTVSEQFVGELVSSLEDFCDSVVVSCYCEKLVAEAKDRSGTQKKGNVCRWKLLPSNG